MSYHSIARAHLFQISSVIKSFCLYNHRTDLFQDLPASLMLRLYVTRSQTISQAAKITFLTDFYMIYLCQIAENWPTCTETMKLNI